MGLKFREDSITGIRLRDALKTKTATSAELVDGAIVLELMPEGGVCTGTMVKFTAPCDCTSATGGLIISGVAYTIIDTMGECVTGIDGVWDAGAQIAVLIDHENRRACIQNPATKRIWDELNKHIKDKNNPHEVKASQVEVGEDVEKALGLDPGASAAAAFLSLYSEKCSIASGAYVGHLEATDPATSVTIEFPFRPKLIVCVPSDMTTQQKGWLYAGGNRVIEINSKASGTSLGYHSISFSGNAASLGAAPDNADCFDYVCRKGTTYRWVALG